MIYSVDFMDLTEKINPHAVVRYLKDTGWMQYKTKKEYIKIFQKITEKEEFYQVIIPIDKTLADYKKAMFDAIEQIAFLEGQSTEQLMLYLLNPNTDLGGCKMSQEEKYKLALFAVIRNSSVMPQGIKLGKTMHEINTMTVVVMANIMESCDFERLKESYESV